MQVTWVPALGDTNVLNLRMCMLVSVATCHAGVKEQGLSVSAGLLGLECHCQGCQCVSGMELTSPTLGQHV